MGVRGELHLLGGDGMHVVSLDEARLTVGRDETAELRLDEPMVSRQHAEILRLGNDFLLRDHGSTNGSYVNDIRVAERLLADGDVVRFGKAGPELVFRTFEETAPLVATTNPSAGTTATLVAALGLKLESAGADPVEEANLRCLLAETHVRKGRSSEAISVLSKYNAEGALEALPNQVRAEVQRWLGTSLSEAKEYRRAVELLRDSLTRYGQAGDTTGGAEAHVALGRALLGLDDMLPARDHLHRATLVARQSGNERVRAEAHLLIGKIDWKESDLEGARYHWGRAARLAEGTTDELLKTRVSLQHAFTLYAEGNLQEAIAAYQKAIQEIEELGNVRILLKAYSTLSRALTRAGSWIATERLLERRLALARELDLAKPEAVALTDLAELRLLQGRLRPASKVILRAVERHGDAVYARTQRILGRVLVAEGRVADAVRALERGLEVARSKGALEEQILIGLELAMAHLALGDDEAAARAVDVAESTTTLDPALGLIARVRFVRGAIDVARGLHAEANRAFSQAMSIFSSTGDPYRVALCHREIGLLRAMMDRAESGRAHLEKAREAFAVLGATADLMRIEQSLNAPPFANVEAAMTRPLSLAMRTGGQATHHSAPLASRTIQPEEAESPAAPYRVLLAVSDGSLADLLGRGLEVENYVVDRVEHGRAALDAAIAEPPVYDLLLLDALLEYSSGFDVCRDLRKRKLETPVMLLGSRAGIADKIEALQVGADDYVFRHGFVFEEVLAKMEALLR